MTLTRRFTLAFALLLGFFTLASGAFAEKHAVFNTNGVAINGYDPVAYFTESKPVEGDAAYSSEWNGAKFLFASAENKATFDGNPEKYAPQYGGYCAYAVSKGYTANTVPEAWSIVDDKLYLNYSVGVRRVWERDTAGYISSAEANWPAVLK